MQNYVQKIQETDLQYLADQLVHRYHWDPTEAQEVLRKYKNFMILWGIKPGGLGLVPTREIDEVWHLHILFTKNYTADCLHIFGSYKHHTPSLGSEDEQKALAAAYIQTAKLYEHHFKEPYGHAIDPSLWFEDYS